MVIQYSLYLHCASRCQLPEMCRVSDKGTIINPNGRVALLGACVDLCHGALAYTWTILAVTSGRPRPIRVGKEGKHEGVLFWCL